MRMAMKRRHEHMNDRAFTLVEMLAVILVVGILVTIVVGVAGKGIEAAATAKTKEGMVTIMNAVDAYYEENQAYPTDVDGDSAGLFTALRNCEASKLRLGALTSDTAREGKFYDGFEQIVNFPQIN